MWEVLGCLVVVLLLAYVLIRILWRNAPQVLGLFSIGLLVWGGVHEGRVTLLYGATSAAAFALACFIAWLRRPRPITVEQLCSFVEPAVEIETDADRELLRTVCFEAMIDPDFKDHWNATQYNPGKRASLAQKERIREMGYTGKMPQNMRAASALIEVLKIVKQYRVRKWELAKAAAVS